MPKVARRYDWSKVGVKRGRWTILGPTFPVRNDTGEVVRWCVCQCECGTIAALSYGHAGRSSKSCGCLTKEYYNRPRKCSGHPLYSTYKAMLSRCTRENDPAFRNYGGRGICVCNEWATNPESFFAWALENGWHKGLELDRKDNDSGYSPGNCRIVTAIANNRNKRTNTRLVAFGEEKTLIEWAEDERCCVSASGIMKRIERGWPVEAAISYKKTHRHYSPYSKAKQ